MPALAAAAVLAGALPGGDWNAGLALFASIAALVAALERRDRDMLIAIGIAAGLAPAGWLFVPLCLGCTIRRGAARQLPIALFAGLTAAMLLPWPTPASGLPGLTLLESAVPTSRALVWVVGAGLAAWLGARASIAASAHLLAEARLGAIMLAAVLPLSPVMISLVVALAVLARPAPVQTRSANDNPARGARRCA